MTTQNFEVVTVADVDDEDRVGNRWKLMFGHKVKLLFRLFEVEVEVQARFEAGVWSVFCC